MRKRYFTVKESNVSNMSRVYSRNTQGVASAAALWNDVIKGRTPTHWILEAMAPTSPHMARMINGRYPSLINESMTTSDFPLLTGDVINRMMLARYNDFPKDWQQFTSVRPGGLADFRQVRSIAADGLEGVWDDIPEGDNIQYAAMSETGYNYTPKKYGQAARLSFEQIMNDDLGAFMTIPDRLGRGGARTVSKFVTELYVDASGPHASFYTVGNSNLITGNPVLSIASLQTAYTTLRNQTDSDGEPIYINGVVLVVPPALEVTARNILNLIIVDTTEAGGTSNQTVRTNNWMVNNIRLVVDPYIPIVASTANGATSWFLFADPNESRPALEVGFLRGFDQPRLYQRLPDVMNVGGGAADPMYGDFSTMATEYKGVIAFGGTRVDPKVTVASNGSGS